MSIKQVVFALIIFFSCCSRKTTNKNLNIILEFPPSYKIDLGKGVYTVFFLSKLSEEVSFSISSNEREKIINEYYALGLEEIPDKTTFIDNCQRMPKFFSVLRVRSTTGVQEIKIDDDCDDFTLAREGRKVKKFLVFIRVILDVNPQIKNAPKSDILNM